MIASSTLLRIILAVSLQSPEAAVPRFERGPCRPAVREGERVDCGMLVVPENRDVSGSSLIKVPVKIFRSRSANPLDDPIVFMLGGPGGSTRNTTGVGIPFLDNRDYIVVDQRGTRLGEPALACTGVDSVRSRMAHGTLSGSAAEAELTRSAGECATQLRKKGIDLDGYHSRAIAADLEDLRRVLGIKRWNLYGVSYSVRVMLIAMREHPETIRSAFLDSPLSLESRYDEVAANSVIRALNIVIDACLASASCAQEHPQVRTNLSKAVERFDAQPQWVVLDSAKTDSIFVTGAVLASAFTALLNSPSSAAALPLVVDRAANGDIKALTGIFGEEVQRGGYTTGMRLAVWCSEVMPFQDRAAITAQSNRELGLGGMFTAVIPPAGCDSMRIKPGPASDGAAVKSDIPTLILSGEIDAYVPTPWARSMLANMPRAFVLEVKGAGHGPGFSDCGQKVAFEFFNDPTRVPATDCLAKGRGVQFTR